MIPIRLPDRQKALNDHWNGVEKLFFKKDKVKILNWIQAHQLQDILGDDDRNDLQIKNLILAEPQILRLISYRVGGILKSKDAQNKNLGFIKTKYTSFTGRDDHLYQALNLVENTGVTVCPYCNRTYIQSVKKTDKKSKRTCQLDHFFPKDTYPYLALCFYNLIPSCSACNHIKSTEEIGISPYEIDSADDVIHFEWKPKDATFNYPKGNISVKPVPNPKTNEHMQTNIDVLGLETLYSYHDDIVKEMLLKGEVYSPDYIQSLIEQFPDLIENEEEALRIVTGNYTEEEDLGKRPLSKLTRDIARDVGFLKK